MHAPKSEGGTEFEKHPPGSVATVCTRVIDMGTHFNPRQEKDQRKLMLAFESSRLMEQEGEFKGEPFLLFANFNYSMYQGKAHLCNFIESWIGRRFASQDEADQFDLSTLIGRTAFCNVIHSDDGKWVNIQSIMPVPEGVQAPLIKGKTILIDQDNLDQNEIAKLSDKVKEKVLSAKEQATSSTDPMHQAMSENPGAGMKEDDVPF